MDNFNIPGNETKHEMATALAKYSKETEKIEEYFKETERIWETISNHGYGPKEYQIELFRKMAPTFKYWLSLKFTGGFLKD